MVFLQLCFNQEMLELKFGKLLVRHYSISINALSLKYKDKPIKKIFYFKICLTNNKIKLTLMIVLLTRQKDLHSH